MKFLIDLSLLTDTKKATNWILFSFNHQMVRPSKVHKTEYTVLTVTHGNNLLAMTDGGSSRGQGR